MKTNGIKFLIVILQMIIAINIGCAKPDKTQIERAKLKKAIFYDTLRPKSKPLSTISKFQIALNEVKFKLSPLKDSLQKTQSRMQTVKEERTNDSLFLVFRELHREYQAQCDSFLIQDSIDSYLSSSEPPKAGALYKTVADSFFKSFGYTLLAGSGGSGKGGWYFDQESQFFIDNFYKYISESMKEYLAYRTKEQAEGFSEDASLLIPYDSVVSRAITWEKFLDKYPSFILKDEVSGLYTVCLRAYLAGLDNSSVFSGKDGKLATEVKKSYERAIQQHPGTNTVNLVKRWYAFLEMRNFKRTADIDSFLTVHYILKMVGVEPPKR